MVKEKEREKKEKGVKKKKKIIIEHFKRENRLEMFEQRSGY